MAAAAESKKNGLHVFRWEPAAEKKIELLIVHGYLEHAARYDEVARALGARGIAVTAFDLRGHGRSDGARGYVERFTHYLDDLGALLDPLSAPRFLLGHSLGGLIALRFVQERAPRIHGLILTNPYLERALAVPGWKLAAGRFLGRWAPSVNLPAELDRKLLTHDAAILEAHEKDPLILDNANARWFVEVTAAQQAAAAAMRVDVPLLVAIGDADQVASPAFNRRWFEALAAPDKTVRVLPGQFHEVLNEVERPALHQEVGDWILARAH